MVEYLTPNSFIEEVEMDQERIDDERVDPPVPAELGECEGCGSTLLQDDDHSNLESYNCNFCCEYICEECERGEGCILCVDPDENGE